MATSHLESCQSARPSTSAETTKAKNEEIPLNEGNGLVLPESTEERRKSLNGRAINIMANPNADKDSLTLAKMILRDNRKWTVWERAKKPFEQAPLFPIELLVQLILNKAREKLMFGVDLLNAVARFCPYFEKNQEELERIIPDLREKKIIYRSDNFYKCPKSFKEKKARKFRSANLFWKLESEIKKFEDEHGVKATSLTIIEERGYGLRRPPGGRALANLIGCSDHPFIIESDFEDFGKAVIFKERKRKGDPSTPTREMMKELNQEIGLPKACSTPRPGRKGIIFSEETELDSLYLISPIGTPKRPREFLEMEPFNLTEGCTTSERGKKKQTGEGPVQKNLKSARRYRVRKRRTF